MYIYISVYLTKKLHSPLNSKKRGVKLVLEGGTSGSTESLGGAWVTALFPFRVVSLGFLCCRLVESRTRPREWCQQSQRVEMLPGISTAKSRSFTHICIYLCIFTFVVVFQCASVSVRVQVYASRIWQLARLGRCACVLCFFLGRNARNRNCGWALPHRSN